MKARLDRYVLSWRLSRDVNAAMTFVNAWLYVGTGRHTTSLLVCIWCLMLWITSLAQIEHQEKAMTVAKQP